MSKPTKGTGSASNSKPGGNAKSQQPTSGAGIGSMGAMLGKSARKTGIRTGRRLTTDPVTTHVAMEQFISLRQGLMHGKIGLKAPTPDLAPRVFPGSRTIAGLPEKGVLK